MREILVFVGAFFSLFGFIPFVAWLSKPDPKEIHFHLCPRAACGTIWAHRPADIAPGEEAKAHRCHRCGASDKWARASMREALQERLENRSRAFGMGKT